MATATLRRHTIPLLLLLLFSGNAIAQRQMPEAQPSAAELQKEERDLEAAIVKLQRFRQAQPRNLSARLRLAKYLAWNGQPREAVEVADEALAIAPDNLLAKNIKATASSWRGDYATAIPLFEEVLEKGEDFDTRLNYYLALANVGIYLWTPDLISRFDPQNDFQVMALEDLRWTQIRRSGPNSQYQREHYGAPPGDMEPLLDYYQALTNLGNYQWAASDNELLKVENDYQAQALQSLNWTLMRKSAPSLQFQQEYYSDALDNSRSTRFVRLKRPWRNTMAFLAAGQSSVADGFGYNFDLSMFEGGLETALNYATQVTGAIGLSKYDNFDTENVSTARLRLQHTLPDLRLGLEFRREPHDDFTYIVFNQIKTSKTKFEAQYLPSDFWEAKLDYIHTNYSDDNRSNETGVTLRYVIHHLPPKISIGYKVEQLGFERQTFHGYFDPDKATAHKALLQLYQGGDHHELGGELFFGHQDIKNLGATQDDSITGWQLFYHYHWLKNILIETAAEGANYGLNKPYQYRYTLFKLNLSLMY